MKIMLIMMMIIMMIIIVLVIIVIVLDEDFYIFMQGCFNLHYYIISIVEKDRDSRSWQS